MGAWGTRPFDSDGALDWYGSKVSPLVVREVQAALEEDGEIEYMYQQWYAAAGLIPLLARIPDIYLQELAPLAVQRLQQIRDDKELVSSWRDPNRFLHDVARTQKALQAITQEQPRTSLFKPRR